MKSLIFIFILTFVLLHKYLNSDSSSTSKCPTLNELNFGLKLLQSLPYNPNTNQVFSPLALKLSLLAIASTSHSKDNFVQAKAIYRLLYDNVNEFAGYDGIGSVENKPSLNLTKLEQLLASTVETTTPQLPYSHLVYYMNKTWKDMSKATEDEWWSYNYERTPRTQEELDLWLCASFNETVENETVLGECLKFLKDKNKPQTSLQLSARQNVELCRSFGVKSFFDCLQLITSQIGSTNMNIDKRIFVKIDKILDYTSATARQLAHIHNKLIYQLLFVNDSFVKVGDNQWRRNLDSYGLKMFDLHNATQINQWKQFKRNSLSGLLLCEFGSFASQITEKHNQPNYLLDIVMYDLKFADQLHIMNISNYQFTIGKRNFYGPKFDNQSNVQDEDQIFQIEMLINFKGKFSVVVHNYAEKNHTLISLPYVDHRFSLVLVLPDKNSTIPEMVRGLTSVQLEHYLQLLHSEKRKIGLLSIPRFSIVGSANVRALLSPLINITSFNLTVQNGQTMQLPLANVQQFIQVINFGADELNSDLRTSHVKEQYVKEEDSLRFNRPFMYMVVSKRLDLVTRKRSFNILVTGFYNGPEEMLGL